MLTLLLLTLTSVYANLPVVLWHGMGDSCCDENSIGYFKSALESRLDVYVHSVQIGTDVSQDEYAGFFGQIEQQVLSVCDLFQTIPELKGGFNAIGFSQGISNFLVYYYNKIKLQV